MSEWKELKIEDFCEVIGGGTPSTKEDSYYGGDISWITPRDLTNYKNRFISRGERNITDLGLKNSSAKILPKNSILLTSRAPIGYLAIAENEVCTNQGFKSLIVDAAKADYNFVYYLIKSDVERIKGLGTGTTFAEISGSVVKGLKFTIPDLPTQTAIAEILSSLDDKIELNNKINQELEALAQILFKQWFIDFEFPNENGEPYKSTGGEMVDSELGEIPKGWEVNKLKEVTKQIKPGTNFQPKRTAVGIPFLNVRNINSGFIDTSDSKLISIEDYHSVHKVWQPEKMDILISRIGTLGLVAPILFKDLPIAVHYNFILIKPGKLNSKFLYFLLKSDDFQLKYKSLAKASVQEYVTIDEVQDIEILMPNDSVISNFIITFDSLFDKIESSYLESQELIKLRDTLLPKLISGELEINELPN
jgi:type I restriction enzyme S subunit